MNTPTRITLAPAEQTAMQLAGKADDNWKPSPGILARTVRAHVSEELADRLDALANSDTLPARNDALARLRVLFTDELRLPVHDFGFLAMALERAAKLTPDTDGDAA